MASSKKQAGVPTDDEILAGMTERTETAPPPGMGDDGLNVVDEDTPPWTPDIADEDTFEEDYSDLED